MFGRCETTSASSGSARRPWRARSRRAIWYEVELNESAIARSIARPGSGRRAAPAGWPQAMIRVRRALRSGTKSQSLTLPQPASWMKEARGRAAPAAPGRSMASSGTDSGISPRRRWISASARIAARFSGATRSTCSSSAAAVVEVAKLDQGASERDARRHVRRVPLQPGAAGLDRFGERPSRRYSSASAAKEIDAGSRSTRRFNSSRRGFGHGYGVDRHRLRSRVGDDAARRSQ